MPVAPAAYHVLLGWSYLDTRGVDVVSHGNDEVAPSPYLGMGFEPVFPLDERKGRLDCFPNFPIPLPEGFGRACHVAFIDDFHCFVFFVGRLSPPRFLCCHSFPYKGHVPLHQFQYLPVVRGILVTHATALHDLHAF